MERPASIMKSDWPSRETPELPPAFVLGSACLTSIKAFWPAAGANKATQRHPRLRKTLTEPEPRGIEALKSTSKKP